MPTAPQPFRADKRRKERHRGTKQQRGYGGEWERISRLYRASHPICEVCQQAPAVDTDHVRPFKSLKDPLRTAWSNLQAVCRACHNRKTHGEG